MFIYLDKTPQRDGRTDRYPLTITAVYIVNILLESVAIAMNCNLKPSDAAPVFIRFNCDAHSKFDVAQSIRCSLIAFLLLIRCVTLWSWPLTCDRDLWPLTLNNCSVSSVTWWKSVPYLSEIENPRRSYCDLNVWPYGVKHVSSVKLRSGIIFTKS